MIGSTEKWECSVCGEINIRTIGQPPTTCENPNCNKKGPFKKIEEISEKTTTFLCGHDIFKELCDYFEKTVKEDRRIIEIILAKMFSTYTPEPGNLGIEAPTSEGKTYPVVEIAKLFPKEDIWFLGGLSPKALVHEHGKLLWRDGSELSPVLEDLRKQEELAKAAKNTDTIAEIRRKRRLLMSESYNLVTLENKILIFLESPELETWGMLRPILSHDVYETAYKYTDKQSLITYTVILRGWPAAIYSKAGRGKEDLIWDQIQSRFTTISPKMDAKKYRAAVELTATRRGLPTSTFIKKLKLETKEDIKSAINAIKIRLTKITESGRKAAGEHEINIFWLPFYAQIGADFPAHIGKHMRDSKRFLEAIQMSAAINVFNRPILKLGETENVIATMEDFARATKLYFEEGGEEIFSGLPANVIKFFNSIIVPLSDKMQQEITVKETGEEAKQGITVKEMVEETKKQYNRPKSSKTISKHYLPSLEEAGLVSSETDPNDKRQNIWTVLQRTIIPELGANSSLIKNALDFSLDNLKEAWEELEQIGEISRVLITHNTTTECEITLDELYEKHFLCNRLKNAPIELCSQLSAFAESADLIFPISQTQLKAPISTLRGSLPAHLFALFGTTPFKETDIYLKFPDAAEAQQIIDYLYEAKTRGKAILTVSEQGSNIWRLVG